MAQLPHFITDPADSSSWDFRQDCLAWELFTSRSFEACAEFVKARPKMQKDNFTERLMRCRAWWMLTYLPRYLIVAELDQMPRDEAEKMRAHLNAMREQMKNLSDANKVGN